MSKLREFIFKNAQEILQGEKPQLESEIQFLEMKVKQKRKELNEINQLLKEICEEYDFEIRESETKTKAIYPYYLVDKKGQCE